MSDDNAHARRIAEQLAMVDEEDDESFDELGDEIDDRLSEES